MNKINIHATCISYQDNGILLIGPSGSGKSDVALQMIMNKHALLVADDRTDIEEKDGRLIASCPEAISGMMEVRGLGLCHFDTLPSVALTLVVHLVSEKAAIARFPKAENIEILGVRIPKIRVRGFETSAIDKIILACYQNK